jgi:carboxypeptidase C (cathepsin A)
MRPLLAMLLASALAAASPVAANPLQEVAGPLVGPIASEHHARIGGGEVSYRAVFTETALKGADGRAQATISATAYLRTDGAHAPTRPVVFLFNGGPGASSSPLQFEALGPRLRVRSKDQPDTFIDNASSLLDAADLVFIDPVATGFSRVLPGGDASPWLTPEGDAQAMVGFVQAWLRDNGRAASPVYLVGESYGGFRLALMLKEPGALNLMGVAVVSPLLDASATAEAKGNDLPYVFALPSMAVAAFAQHKGSLDAPDAKAAFDAASAFAQDDYARALLKGQGLAPGERDRIAARMSAMIGLPAARIAQLDLRVPSQVFLDELVPGQVVGRLDSRVSGPRPVTKAGRPAAADDPALGMKGKNQILAPGITAYMSGELGVPLSRPYVSLNLDVAFEFRTRPQPAFEGAYVNPTPNIAAALERSPEARLLLIGGYYDMAVPLLGPIYALDHAGVPRARTEVLAVAAGHSPYDTSQQRAAVSAALHRLVER